MTESIFVVPTTVPKICPGVGFSSIVTEKSVVLTVIPASPSSSLHENEKIRLKRAKIKMGFRILKNEYRLKELNAKTKSVDRAIVFIK